MTRPLRADARRNRDAMLAAVRHLLATHGPDLSMDAIAESAGVAVGTLYRHFPTKTDLLRAALSQLVEAMVCDVEAVADRVDGGAPARSELLALVDRTLDAAAADRATKAAAGALGTSYPDEYLARASAALSRLIAAAQAEGALRDDATPEDFYLLLDTAPTEPALRGRWRELMIAGLTSRE